MFTGAATRPERWPQGRTPITVTDVGGSVIVRRPFASVACDGFGVTVVGPSKVLTLSTAVAVSRWRCVP